MDSHEFFEITSPTTDFSAFDISDVEGGNLPRCSSTPCDLTAGIEVIELHSQSFEWIDGTIGECLPPFPGCLVVGGGLTFPNPGFVLALPPNTFFTLSGTIPFSGQLEGAFGYPAPIIGPLVFSVDLSGMADYTITGQENSTGTAAIVDETQYSFVGIATPVPEPSTLLLLGSGLVAFARRIRKQQVTLKCR